MAEFGYFAKKILQNRFKLSIFGLIKSLNKMFHFYKIGRFLLNETHVTPNTSYTTNFFSNETHLKYLIYNFLFSQLKSQNQFYSYFTFNSNLLLCSCCCPIHMSIRRCCPIRYTPRRQVESLLHGLSGKEHPSTLLEWVRMCVFELVFIACRPAYTHWNVCIRATNRQLFVYARQLPFVDHCH